MNFDNNFVSFEDWIDFVFESLTSKGIAVDEEIIEAFVESSIEFLVQEGIISGFDTISMGYEEEE
jgi:hypothetical protein